MGSGFESREAHHLLFLGGIVKNITVIPVISGGVSLGAYEAGVMYALLIAQRKGKIEKTFNINIPAISGTSAGSITALISSYIITDGLSPYILKEIWVDLMDIDIFLQEKTTNAILSRKGILNYAKKALKKDALCKEKEVSVCAENMKRGCKDKSCPFVVQKQVVISMTLTNLFGRREYLNKENKEREEIVYKDSVKFVKRRGENKTIWFEYAMASSSVPVVFPYVTLKRKKKEYPYLVKDVYSDTILFDYVDGGLMNNRPVNFAVDMAFESNAEEPHILLIEPDINKEEKKETKPLSILSRVMLKLSAFRDIVEEVRNIEKTNKKIDALESFYAKLANAIDSLENKEIFREYFKGEYPEKRELLNSLSTDKDTVSILESIAKEMEKDIGLKGKIHFEIDFIYSSKDRLCGDFMGHFGGFFRKELRENDFITGIKDAKKFLKEKHNILIDDFEIEKEYIEDLNSLDINDLGWKEYADMIRILKRSLNLFIKNRGLRFILSFIIIISSWMVVSIKKIL